MKKKCFKFIDVKNFIDFLVFFQLILNTNTRILNTNIIASKRFFYVIQSIFLLKNIFKNYLFMYQICYAFAFLVDVTQLL